MGSGHVRSPTTPLPAPKMSVVAHVMLRSSASLGCGWTCSRDARGLPVTRHGLASPMPSTMSWVSRRIWRFARVATIVVALWTESTTIARIAPSAATAIIGTYIHASWKTHVRAAATTAPQAIAQLRRRRLPRRDLSLTLRISTASRSEASQFGEEMQVGIMCRFLLFFSGQDAWSPRSQHVGDSGQCSLRTRMSARIPPRARVVP